MDLEALLPRLLSRAIVWAEGVAANVAATGAGLDESGLSDARTVGVERPGDVRVMIVDEFPFPADPELQAACRETGLLGPSTAGLTLGYSILIGRGHWSRRLLSHECRHVFQYEQSGSIASFLPLYLASVVQFGYWDSPYERDAREHELGDA